LNRELALDLLIVIIARERNARYEAI